MLSGGLLRRWGIGLNDVESRTQEPSSGDGVDRAAKPTRRLFTAEYLARVLAAYEAAPHGEKSAVLRREGIETPGPSGDSPF